MAAEQRLRRKIAVIGFRGVGKSAMTTVFVERRFPDNYEPTIEQTMVTVVRFPEADVEFETEIIDTAGQDEFSFLSRKASVGIHGYLLVFSFDSRESLAKLSVIHDRIVEVTGNESIPAVVVANKNDAPKTESEVDAEEGRAFAARIRAPFVECSAKLNRDVDKAFRLLLQHIERDSGVLEPKKKGGCVLL